MTCLDVKYPIVVPLYMYMYNYPLSFGLKGGRRSPAVACWDSDHWVASSNPLRGKFRH